MNPVCQACLLAQKKKYGDNASLLTCKGIKEDVLEDVPLDGYTDEEKDNLRDILDISRWAKKHLGITLRSYQELMAKCTSLRKVSRCGRQIGKALDINTPIPTPMGWKKMSDIKPGDQVFTEKGLPCIVTTISEIETDRDCYSVTFNDNSEIIADGKHQWTVDVYKKYNSGKPEGRKTLTTEEMVNDFGYIDYRGKHGYRYAIPEMVGVSYSEKELLIDPYVLGIWLGDGHSYSSNITVNKNDSQIIEEINRRGYNTELRGNINGNLTIGISKNGKTLRSLLSKLNLVENKHIPDIYLQGSREQRIDLLKGLMDSDGHYAPKTSRCEITSVSLVLSSGYQELLSSLGIKNKRKLKRTSVLYKGVKVIGEAYRVDFIPPEYSVFNLNRKTISQESNLKKRRLKQTKCRRIVEIKKVSSRPVKCLVVDNPTHLYLAGPGFIATHNSETLAIYALHYAFTHADKKVLFIAPQETQIKLIFERFEKWRGKSREIETSIAGCIKDPWTLKLRNGSQILGLTAGTKSGMAASNIRGQSADVVILDEADYLSEDDINTILMILKKTDVEEDYNKVLWVSSTPTGAHKHFWRWCTDSPRFKEFHFRSQDSPTWSVEEEASFLEQYGSKTCADWLHEVEADFGEQLQGVYPHSYIDRAKELAMKFYGESGSWDYKAQIPRAGCLYTIGVDWNSARNGVQIIVLEYDTALTDSAAFEKGIRGRFRVAYRESVGGIEFVQSEAVKKIIDLNYMWNPRAIYVDQGFGYQQIEDLRRYGHSHPQSKLITKLKGKDLGSMIEITDPHTKQPIKKPLKPYMVNNSRMFFEKDLIVLNKADKELEKQLRDYSIDHFTQDNRPVYTKGFDHVLDAYNFALLAYTLEFTDLGKPIWATNMHIVGRFGEKTTLTPDEFPDENPDGTIKVIDKTAHKRPPVVPRAISGDRKSFFAANTFWQRGKYNSRKSNMPVKRDI